MGEPDRRMRTDDTSESVSTDVVRRYALAVLSAILALLLRRLAAPFLGENNPYHTVWAAVVFSAWYCGLGPSLVTTLLSALGVWYWFLPPANSFSLGDTKTAISGILGFLVFSGLIIALGEANRRSLSKSKWAEEQLRQAHNQLEQKVQERTAELNTANENLREFAHVASHDLQEPLRSVAGFSELLRRKYKGKLDDQADEFIELINSGAIRMQNLIRALLEYSRATASSAAEPVAPVDSAAALRVALDNLNTAIQSTGASIQTLELPTVKAHEIALVQLFQNLISNAIKYSKEHPLIQISAQRDAEFWKFSVADNGIGIDPHDQERIFHIFKRAHGDEYPGSGIGLAICSRIVERYGGRIWVEAAPGQGSTFYFSLPAAPE